MKFLRILVLLDAAFLMFLGFGIIVDPEPFLAVYPEAKLDETAATLRVLGTAVGGLAIVVLATATLSLLGNYRQFALWLSFANVLLAVMTGIQQQAIWGSTVGWFLFLIPLVLGASLAWVGLRPLKPGEAAAELTTLQMPEEIRQALLRQIGEAAAQEERNRLARDLHDSIKQQLFSINVGTAAAQERWERDPEGARAVLADVRRSSKEAMVEMQALLHQLRPEALTSTGLVEALREQCEALGYRTGAEVTLELGEPLPDDRLVPGTEETLFRIAQEALSNVARHARARKVRVWLGRDGESARLHIEDDGQGFDPEKASSGMGLRNLRERTESLGGRLDVVSTSGSGTRIGVYIPLLASPSEWETRIEEAISRARSDLGIVFLVAAILIREISTDAPSFYEFLIVGFLLASGIGSWGRERSFLQEASGVSWEDVSRLFYVGHRNRTCFFLIASYWAFWYWSVMPGGWSGGRVVWGAAALLCATLAGFELTRFHRWSQFRRAWPKWDRSIFRKHWNLFAGAALVIFACSYNPIPLAKLEWLSPLGAVLVYFLARQPKVKGADT